jgi:quinoprotein relay system zinc metallohydrolase 2
MTRSTPCFILCGLIFSAAPVVSAAAEVEALPVQRIAEGIYVHQGRHLLPDAGNRGEIANVGFVVGEDCVAVIDSGGSPAQGQALKAAIEATTRVPVCHVINTHVHPDHIYGNLAFQQAGVHFVGHHKLPQAMAVRAPYYRDKAARDLGLALESKHFIPPDVRVTDTLTLDLGGRTLQVVAYPAAHTDNDLSVFDQKTGTLWLADLLFMEHVPVVDGSLNGWLKVIDTLATLPAQRVIPGHGPLVARWPEALAAERSYLLALQQEVRAALAAGKTLEQTLAETRAEHYGQWALFDQFHRRNVSTAFAELEWE